MSDCISIALWNPIEITSNEILDVNSIYFSGNTLIISLCDKESNYTFVFSELISNYGSYKYTSTEQNLEFNSKIGRWYEQCGIIGKTYPLLISNSSDYIEAIKRQSYYAFEDSYKHLRHYIFITYDAVIEVVSAKEPNVKKEKLRRDK